MKNMQQREIIDFLRYENNSLNLEGNYFLVRNQRLTGVLDKISRLLKDSLSISE